MLVAMDTIFSYLLSLVVLSLSLALLFLLHKRNLGSSKLPPGNTGWPLVGETRVFALEGPEKFITDRMRKYSPQVFQTSLLGQKMAVFCGAAGNKFLFSNQNKLVTSWWPRSIKELFLFPSFGGDSASTNVFLQEVLKPEALKHYVPVMDSMARQHLDAEWTPNREVKVFPLSKKYIFSLACQLFMSIKDSDHIARLDKTFNLATSGMYSVPIDFPGTAYHRAIKAGKMVREELVAIIRERRKELLIENKETTYHDVVSRMLLVIRENGEFMNEMEISNRLIGLLVPSVDTTSTAVTFVINYLGELPHIYNEVFKEQMEIAKSKGPGELLNWEDIDKMKYSWNVAREALRLMPPGIGTLSETITDFTYDGFTIPKGWKTFWTVHSTHKDLKYFSNPEIFDPSRFERNGPAPYTFVPFGGGPRMCPGKEYARLGILIFMHNVVTRFKLEKTIANEKIVFLPFPIPMNGLPVHLQAHEK